ncbi:MAG: hypothetical protein ABIW47_17785 [Ginsengibacter sp.]
MKFRFIKFFPVLLVLFISGTVRAQQQKTNIVIENTILNEKDHFYYIDFKRYAPKDATLPIGVFDSGTGGLTVLEAILNFDRNNNQSNESGSDDIPDFKNEQFIYLADQANMPYGNYYSAGKSDLLIEHIIKDAQFLLSDKYYPDEKTVKFNTDKKKVKTIVIACNTATAYGKEYIENFIAKTGTGLKIIGVIDAGARGALDKFNKHEDGSIGVMATVGTIASKGYGNTLKEYKDKLGYTGDIQIYNQGGHGIAEAVDEEPDFIDRKAKDIRNNYRGPSLSSAEFRIDKSLLDIYNFDFDHQKMFCDTKNTDDCSVLQINSADNYVRYHLVSMMENIRKTPGAKPLKAILLGCTHYPYLIKDISNVLGELYQYKKEGKYIYRDLMVENVHLIDPAVNVAAELYAYLKEENLLNTSKKNSISEFYITVPNMDNPGVKTENSNFPYDYKYGRNAGEIQQYTKAVPFSKNNIPAETIDRLKTGIPTSFSQIIEFSKNSTKTKSIKKKDRIIE